MAAQRPVSAATRVIGPHRGMAAPRLGERGLARGDGGRAALAGKSPRASTPERSRFVCNRRASASNHI